MTNFRTLVFTILFCIHSLTALASQQDYDINNADANTGVAMRAAINANFQALVGNNSGATAPATTYAYMSWADTTTGLMKQRNAANTAWINKGPMSNPENTIGADIASATTTDIGAATGDYLKITGTTTITSLGTAPAGSRRIVEFTGTLTLTYNGTSLILPGATNVTTAAGDVATFISLGSGNWKCATYQPGSFIQPTGMINYFAMNWCPAGYLNADGAAVSRTTYSALFAIITTYYGPGNGTTTFNTPNLLGEFVRGWDSGSTVDPGRAFGSKQSQEIQGHTHVGGAVSSGYQAGAGTYYGLLSPGSTSSAGGAETRPRNIALMACIKY